MSNDYKTYEELKEELGNNYDLFMYEINLCLLQRIDKAIEYIKNGADFKSLHFIAGQDEDLWKIILSDNVREDLLEILGDKEND